MKKQTVLQKFISIWIISVLLGFAFFINLEMQAASSEIPVFQTLHHHEKQQITQIDIIILQEDVLSKQQIHFDQNLKNFLAVAFAIVVFPTLLFHIFYCLIQKKYTKLWRVVAYIHETDGKKRLFIM